MNTLSKIISSNPSEKKKWLVASLITIFIAAICGLYVNFTGMNLMVFQAWSFISAAVASLLLALALSASSLSYYFGWPDMRWGYQKQIGVMAFWIMCFYCVSLLILYPETYWFGFRENIYTADMMLGITAVFIFGAMVGINSKIGSAYFSWETIKFVLGLGYVGYALLVIRAVLIEWPLWEDWFSTFEGYPPGRLMLSVIAIGVLLMRVSITIHKMTIKKESLKS